MKVYFDIADSNELCAFEGFKNYWQYADKDNLHPNEWGKLQDEYIEIIFMACRSDRLNDSTLTGSDSQNVDVNQRSSMKSEEMT